MKIKELMLICSEYSTEFFYWLGLKLKLRKEIELVDSYAHHQMDMWVLGFNRNNMIWLNRLYEKLSRIDSSARTDEPSVQVLLDRCRQEGLCSENLYENLRQYGDQENGLPLVISL